MRMMWAMDRGIPGLIEQSRGRLPVGNSLGVLVAASVDRHYWPHRVYAGFAIGIHRSRLLYSLVVEATTTPIKLLLQWLSSSIRAREHPRGVLT